jgi:hypothetical protein
LLDQPPWLEGGADWWIAAGFVGVNMGVDWVCKGGGLVWVMMSDEFRVLGGMEVDQG